MFNSNKAAESSPRRKLVNTAAVTLALAGGGVAGAVIGAPLITSAQPDDPTTTTDETTTTDDPTTTVDDTGEDPTATTTPEATPDTEDSDAADEKECGPGTWMHRSGRGIAAVRLDDVAEILGITRDDLGDALDDGQTIAEVAEANGVATEDLVDDLVTDAEAEIDAQIDEHVADGDLDADEAAEWNADVRERITDFVNGELPERPDVPMRGRFGVVDLDTVIDLLGIERDELFEAIDDGQTLAEVAEANGVSRDELISAVVDAAEARIDGHVADGDVDADEAEDLKADLTERITERVNAEPGDFGLLDGRRWGDRGGPRFDRPFDD